MKILSKFSDYYDSGIAYGIDEKLCFIRKRVEIDEKYSTHSPLIINSESKGEALRVVLYFKLLGFCGSLYPLIHLVLEKRVRKNKIESYHNIAETFAYDLQKLDDFLNVHFKTNLKEMKEYQRQAGYYGFFRKIDVRIKKFYEKSFSQVEELFYQYQTPYFLLEEFKVKKEGSYDYPKYKATLLPELKKLKFSQVKTSIEAFQEVSMFLGSLQTQEDNTVKIEDKYLVTAKGFDCYSFKNLPKKKAKKKC